MAANFAVLSVLLSGCTQIYGQFVLIEEDMNWIDANSLCLQRYNSTLATITDLTQNEEAASLCSSQSCWLGLSNLFTYSTYSYIDHQDITLFADFCDITTPSPFALSCVAMDSASSCWSYNHCVNEKMSALCNTASSALRTPSSLPTNNPESYSYINDGAESIPMQQCQSIDLYSMSFQYLCDENDSIVKRIWHSDTECNSDNEHTDIAIESTHFVDYSCALDAELDTVDIDFYQTANLNDAVFSKQIIIDECFATDSASSFQYECSNSGLLRKWTFTDSQNCSSDENMISTAYDDLNYNSEVVVVSSCSELISSTSASTSTSTSTNSNNGTNEDTDSNSLLQDGKILLILIIVLLLVCCSLCVALTVMVWRYFQTQTNEKKAARGKKFSYDLDDEDLDDRDAPSEMNSDQLKSVVSYDVEDHGDLPGIELWKARKQSDYESPPVSMYTEEKEEADMTSTMLARSVDTQTNSVMTMPTKLHPMHSNRSRLVPVDSVDTEMTTVASSVSTNRKMLPEESENVYTHEYYEPTETSAAFRM